MSTTPDAPRINQIMICPYRGHTNDLGQYDPGHNAGVVNEIDVLQTLCLELQRHFEDWGLRWSCLDVFRGPGVKYADRPMRIEPHSLILDLRCGWYTAARSRNLSRVFFGAKHAELLAERFHEALTEWGACANFGHRVSLPKLVADDPMISGATNHGIRLDVFVLNGPEVPAYLRKMRELARDLATVIVEFLRAKDSPAGAVRGAYLR